MKYTIILLFALSCFLSVIKIHVIHVLGTEGDKLNAMRDEIAKMKRGNLQLHQELLQAGTLTTIEAEAKKQGFIPVRKYIYL